MNTHTEHKTISESRAGGVVVSVMFAKTKKTTNL